MRELTLREIQLEELNILKKLDKICNDNGIKYFLAYGTLLGAVRHSGFIPWDDDVDIMMPRNDYEKFLKYCIANKEELKPFVLIHYSTNKEYTYPIARLSDTRYYVDYKNTRDYSLGLFVDIYPLDGCGQTPEEAKYYFHRLEWLKKLITLSGYKKLPVKKEWSKKSVLKLHIGMMVAKTMGCNYWNKKIDIIAKQKQYDNYNYSDCTVWIPCKAGGFRKTAFDELVLQKFEDYDFPIPKEYDYILGIYYGDYMKLPDENERNPHHEYTAYLKDVEEQ